MNYIAKAKVCISCVDDIEKGTVFDPVELGIDACTLAILENAGVVCKETPDEVSDTLPAWPKTHCTLCDVVKAIEGITGGDDPSENKLKNFSLFETYVTNEDSPYCGEAVFICEGKPSVIDPLTLEIVELDPMSTTVGKNPANANICTRSTVIEFFADAGDLTVTNADLLAAMAGGTFDNGLPADDAATVYLHAVDFTLGHLGDEATDGAFASTTCDAMVTDVDTTNMANLEPGGDYPFGNQDTPCKEMPEIELTVKDGSLIKACIYVSVKTNKAGDEALPK